MKWTKISKLGKGKEGTTFIVIDSKGREFAMKTFKKKKSSNKIEKEFKLQKKAFKFGVAPKPIEYNKDEKWIVMEKMDHHLIDNISNFSKNDQIRILEIFKKLDEAKVFHNDANLSNYMVKNNKIYLIDYGFSKKINNNLIKSLETNSPNYKLMLIGFILKLKELKCPKNYFSFLLKFVSEQDKIKYKLS